MWREESMSLIEKCNVDQSRGMQKEVVADPNREHVHSILIA
jgi:hypothetical protein